MCNTCFFITIVAKTIPHGSDNDDDVPIYKISSAGLKIRYVFLKKKNYYSRFGTYLVIFYICWRFSTLYITLHKSIILYTCVLVQHKRSVYIFNIYEYIVLYCIAETATTTELRFITVVDVDALYGAGWVDERRTNIV